MTRQKPLAQAVWDGKHAVMNGTITARVLAAASMAALILCGCKGGKPSVTAAQEAPSASDATRLHGMYSYMADASVFVDCQSGKRWPVATEGDNVALERAYLDNRATPRMPVLVTVEGHLESRPKMDGPGEETMLVVDRFVAVSPEQRCQSMDAITLEDTRWQLIELNGTAVVVTQGGKAPYLELNSKKKSAYGFGGCNRFFGSYQSTDRTLELGALGATRMACPEGMDREQELFATLGTVSRYEIHGAQLLLFADGKLVARFEARPSAE